MVRHEFSLFDCDESWASLLGFFAMGKFGFEERLRVREDRWGTVVESRAFLVGEWVPLSNYGTGGSLTDWMGTVHTASAKMRREQNAEVLGTYLKWWRSRLRLQLDVSPRPPSGAGAFFFLTRHISVQARWIQTFASRSLIHIPFDVPLHGTRHVFC